MQTQVINPSRAALQCLANRSPKGVRVFNALSTVEMTFSPGVDAQFAVAFAYCEANNRMSELFAHREKDKLDALYAKLPITRGTRSIACGDWMAAC